MLWLVQVSQGFPISGKAGMAAIDGFRPVLAWQATQRVDRQPKEGTL